MNATPTFTVATWLDTVLEADEQLAELAPGGIFGRGATVQTIKRIAPSWPAVVYGYLPAGSRDFFSQDGLLYTQARYRIEAIDKAEGATDAYAASARLDALVIAAPQTDTSGRIMRAFRVQPIDRSEVADGGALFQHAGGIYEVWIKAG